VNKSVGKNKKYRNLEQKERIEKLIGNILNNDADEEGYSKLKQKVKENVKAVLAENKQVISVSFAALIQTLKADPEMVKLIYNIPRVNDSEQPAENNNNIPQYLESNKDNISDLAEKHYENLVEVLTNDVMDTAVNSSHNRALPLPQSSSTFSNIVNQSDTYRIEEPEIYDGSKGDIAD
jgi:hypothetical protein